MKKIPLAFSGCLLGLAGVGNLLSDTFPALAHVFSLMSLVLWFFFLGHHLIHWQETRKELQEPTLLSGMATFLWQECSYQRISYAYFPHLAG